ncbi:hypothetical protein QAD02_004477 [Eretmocerus hayati]|uniref:Uncharacterized protein n=1 Tax=Eretmocerus hayati TaxID=131215 RepID=A0ACC2NUH6_9HYME|nr:hypothetical protein QAD02_004477 [Eretmocerus hayati]
MSSLPHLKCLGIGFNWNFTDAGLSTLSNDLKMLDLSSANFTARGILGVLERMQNLEILGVAFLYCLDTDFALSAIEIVKLRPNKLSLKLGIHDTKIDIEKVQNLSPKTKFTEDPEDAVQFQFSSYNI